MFHLMLQRVLHKKWMVCSLLIGNILLIAIAVSHPMYREASAGRMLEDEFSRYIEEENRHPMAVEMVGMVRKRAGTEGLEKIRGLAGDIQTQLGIPVQEKICFQNTIVSTAKSLTIHDGSRNEQKISIASLSDLSGHAEILSGRMYSAERDEDGCFEAVISQGAMISLNLLVGEVLEFVNMKLENGDIIRVRVVGVFSNSDDSDIYWRYSPDYYSNHLMISPELFEQTFTESGDSRYQYNETWTVMFDYNGVSPEQVENIVSVSEGLKDKYKGVHSSVTEPEYIDYMKEYLIKEKQISVTLSILQVPVMVLLCAFLFMISRQMLEMEDNEIALLKSRGAKKSQIVRLYFYQSGFLSGISLIIGLPLGSLICRILGASSAFLEFEQRRALKVEYSADVLAYGIIAVVLSVAMTLLPVFRRDKANIVSVKRKKSRQTKPLWQKLFLDVIILAVSLYGLYTFSKQEEILLKNVLSGEALDPLLFLSSSLFILGAGMFSLRIHALIVNLVYAIGKRSWSPASYTSFLQLKRTRNKQTFIMVFLVLTVAFGMFNTTVARTILANAERNKEYLTGADIVIQEYWKSNAAYLMIDPEAELIYTEPDFGKYGQLAGAEGIAKVYRNDRVAVRADDVRRDSALLAINTKDFGEVTSLDDGLLKYDYYEYLNVLSKNAEAVLVSSNFRDKLGLKIGDEISYTITNSNFTGTVYGVIYGFFDYWPSYSPSSISILPDKTTQVTENYLVVSHLSAVQEVTGVFPYEIWFNMGGETASFYDFAEEQELVLTKCVDGISEKESISGETLFQGTNGILTMSFITILLICCIGYLIYWTLSIRSRELLFGIFRAMGMSRSEIVHMLINEQVLTGCIAIGFGVGIGWLASNLYVPIIQIAYSDTERVLPLELITDGADIARLLVVIGAVFIICLGVLVNQIFRMKISQALKLGED